VVVTVRLAEARLGDGQAAAAAAAAAAYGSAAELAGAELAGAELAGAELAGSVVATLVGTGSGLAADPQAETVSTPTAKIVRRLPARTGLFSFVCWLIPCGVP
jgi:hypothetical protein